jgi:hypothetical protein
MPIGGIRTLAHPRTGLDPSAQARGRRHVPAATPGTPRQRPLGDMPPIGINEDMLLVQLISSMKASAGTTGRWT